MKWSRKPEVDADVLRSAVEVASVKAQVQAIIRRLQLHLEHTIEELDELAAEEVGGEVTVDDDPAGSAGTAP